MRLVLAFIAAIALPTALMVLWYLYGQFQTFDADDPYIWVRTRGFLTLTAAISASFVMILGLPAYLLLRYFNKISWWSTFLSGFSLGAVPAGIFTWPLRYASAGSYSSVNGVETMVDGVPTIAGWVQFIEGVLFFGGLGFIAALAFWLVAPAPKS
ncbi:hypothetical protein KO528_06065 [Saccharophagus degradans]|uniref:hypothetical protein n=1 Tax=Saccharophagus degradans TaxID=86304 RepID=UPI001C09F92B|nr:hypothetical protein [Saccharophagus degradans]MBU2984905.1 hypothetical protein [Saccharophagus degradans]